MQRRDSHVNLEAVFVDSREVVTLHFDVIKLIKAKKVIKVKNLIVFREDVVRRPYMANVKIPILLPHNKDTDLDPLFCKLILQKSAMFLKFRCQKIIFTFVETEARTVRRTRSGTSCIVPEVLILKHFWNQTPLG